MKTSQELFGPLSMRALEEDKYVRQTRGYLPEANVAFIDEVGGWGVGVFKGEGVERRGGCGFLSREGLQTRGHPEADVAFIDEVGGGGLRGCWGVGGRRESGK